MSMMRECVTCRQCGYQEADYIFDFKSKEEETLCGRCGFQESVKIKYRPNGTHETWTHEINFGTGVIRYGTDAWKFYYFHSTGDLTDAERWLRDRLADGTCDAATTYMTRWNHETQRVETVLGNFRDS